MKSEKNIKFFSDRYYIDIVAISYLEISVHTIPLNSLGVLNNFIKIFNG